MCFEPCSFYLFIYFYQFYSSMSGSGVMQEDRELKLRGRV